MSKGIYLPVAKAHRATGDLESAIETMRRAIVYEEPWEEANTARLKEYLKELTSQYNEELMSEMDDVEFHEAFANARKKCEAEGTTIEESKEHAQLLQRYRDRFPRKFPQQV